MRRELPILCSLLPLIFASCRLDNAMIGVFRRLSDSNSSRFLYENVTVGSTSTSRWGDCVQRVDRNSVVFGARRMGNSVCYRCLTLILHTPNVLQVAHQNESICYGEARGAEKSCFDAELVSASTGSFLFRAESLRDDSCGLDGQFDLVFSSRPSKHSCEVGSGTTMSNCNSPNVWNLSFRNCSFPDFEEDLRCLGTWTDARSQRRLVAFFNPETEDYKCGVFTEKGDSKNVEVSFGDDCRRIDETSGADVYRFRSKADPRSFAPCRFPEWIQGEYDSLTVSNDQLEYIQLAADSVPVSTYCVAVENQKVLVYSETKCGEPLGFHCLWFRARSQSVLEYKTTSFDPDDTSLCRDEKQFDANVWSAVLTKSPEPVACGFEGSFTTPQELRHADCYRVVFDCTAKESMKLTSFHCASGSAFDSAGYRCLATWREDDFTFIYAAKTLGETQKCFVTRLSNGRLFFAASSGACPRNFNFTAHADTTLVLEPEGRCLAASSPTPSVGNKTLFDDKGAVAALPYLLLIALLLLLPFAFTQ
ncbi:hypothetical protein QR680_013081 [Steinernema hermaphroditum]|uniref:Uncharacterized protein n=1 Tax=Steinernema hermaphroditum TaxID=289476 RepID=A0AA39I4A8_9BILA|nr:hypothetical protein QR680_013081 [Steinernema hermaphroditum]